MTLRPMIPQGSKLTAVSSSSNMNSPHPKRSPSGKALRLSLTDIGRAVRRRAALALSGDHLRAGRFSKRGQFL
jgi:hypothetical protein